MTAFTLPEGYTFAEPPAILGDVPGYQEYGGATVTQLWDAASVHHIGICAKDGAGVFLFRVFKETTPGVWEHVPLPDQCDGRGSIGVDRLTGQCRYIAWKGNQFFENAIPGAVAFGGGAGDLSIDRVIGAMWGDHRFKDWLYWATTWGADQQQRDFFASLAGGSVDALTQRIAMLETIVQDLQARLHDGGRKLAGDM